MSEYGWELDPQLWKAESEEKLLAEIKKWLKELSELSNDRLKGYITIWRKSNGC